MSQLQHNTESLQKLLEEVKNLPSAEDIVLQDKAVTENGTYTADDGYDGLGTVSVNVPIPDGYIKPSGQLTITENGSYDVTRRESVFVDVSSAGGKVFYTTFTPTSTTNTLRISHGLGCKPTRYVVTFDPSNATNLGDLHSILGDNGLSGYDEALLALSGTDNGEGYRCGLDYADGTVNLYQSSSFALGSGYVSGSTSTFSVRANGILFLAGFTYSIVLIAE